MWLDPGYNPNEVDEMIHSGTACTNDQLVILGVTLTSSTSILELNVYGDTSPSTNKVVENRWQFVVGEWNSTTNAIALYYNGALASNGFTTGVVNTDTASAKIGNSQGCTTNAAFNGSIADVQIYNTSLSANEVTALYQEGIGGHALAINNLVGWWPLNGNANDYSGNNNDGTATNVAYTESWTSEYSAP